MGDRLDADPLLDEQAGHDGPHAALRARAVGHVDGIDARVTQRGHVGEHPVGVDAAGRHDLH